MIENFLIIDDFDVEEHNQKYKLDMLEKFIQEKYSGVDNSSGYNSEYTNPKYRLPIAIKFKQLIHDTFSVGESLRDIRTWIYAQNDEYYKDVWHDHIRTSTVNAVYYIDPPLEGGELELCYNTQIFKLKPEPKKIYMFPSWLSHRPTKQIDKHWRISINVEYLCRERPIVKKTGVMW